MLRQKGSLMIIADFAGTLCGRILLRRKRDLMREEDVVSYASGGGGGENHLLRRCPFKCRRFETGAVAKVVTSISPISLFC